MMVQASARKLTDFMSLLKIPMPHLNLPDMVIGGDFCCPEPTH
ncbi:hypothetical protein D082_05290 [Synechocystis sp. PCC 6714]|nr:hypothetical protein D082_05290 [Synechocystis sp. PCC 6714]